LNEAIIDAQQVRSFADLSVELRLYGLYLARAVANLTESVAKPVDARRDLDLASFLRPGAVFPRALATLLEVVESPSVTAAIERVEGELQRASPERRAVVGRLLWMLARTRPVAEANLMTFSLEQRERLLLHALATRWIDQQPVLTTRQGQLTGLAAQLHELASEALQLAGEPAALRAATARVAETVARVAHPDSPLQGWYGVTQLLERPRSSEPLLDAAGGSMSPRLQLASWDALLSLSPPRSLLEPLLAHRFEDMRNQHAGLPGLARTSALIHVETHSDIADALVSEWIAEAVDDPEAMFARLTLELRSSDMDGALDAAMAAVQNAADRSVALERVGVMCETAALTAAVYASARMRALARMFRAVPP